MESTPRSIRVTWPQQEGPSPGASIDSLNMAKALVNKYLPEDQQLYPEERDYSSNIHFLSHQFLQKFPGERLTLMGNLLEHLYFKNQTNHQVVSNAVISASRSNADLNNSFAEFMNIASCKGIASVKKSEEISPHQVVAGYEMNMILEFYQKKYQSSLMRWKLLNKYDLLNLKCPQSMGQVRESLNNLGRRLLFFKRNFQEKMKFIRGNPELESDIQGQIGEVATLDDMSIFRDTLIFQKLISLVHELHENWTVDRVQRLNIRAQEVAKFIKLKALTIANLKSFESEGSADSSRAKSQNIKDIIRKIAALKKVSRDFGLRESDRVDFF